MAADGISPSIAIRSGSGIELWNSSGFKIPYVPNGNFSREESKFCRAISFSPDGRYLAWANGSQIKVTNTKDWSIVCTLPRPKAYYIKFSPKGNYLCTWEVYTTNKDNPEGSPNLYVYKITDSESPGKQVYAAVQKKQDDWEPSWAQDESLFALMIGGEGFFYEITTDDSFKTVAKKLGGGRNGSLSLGPGVCPPHVAFYVPGTKGSPSMCKIFKYPHLTQPIGCKSFFQADRVEMKWNKKGTGLILLTSTDVDTTGASYYGKQALHFMSGKGESFSVQLGKDGPVHAVQWSPKSNEFCVVYGYMPAKATIYNLKCDPVFDFGEGPRNSIYYNDFGNILLLTGFGNLQGYVEVWDPIKRKQITSLQVPDTTLLEWHPKGEMFLTATTAPRLRMGNGFKVWHYCGALLHETLWPEGQELLEVCWQKYPDGTLAEPQVTDTKIEGIKPSQPLPSTQVYRPPNARGILQGKNPKSTVPGNEPLKKPPQQQQKSNAVDNGTEANSYQAKNRNRRPPKPNTGKPQNNNKKPPGKLVTVQVVAQETTKNETTNVGNTATNNSNGAVEVVASAPAISVSAGENQQQQQQSQRGQAQRSRNSDATTGNNKAGKPKPFFSNNRNHFKQHVSTGDPEKDKRIRAVSKKLHDIVVLKQRRDRGERLESNQLEKINSEKSLIDEMKNLRAS